MSGCAISGILNKKGKRFSGEKIINSIELMHERSNGKGGGFAAYGIYPDHTEEYAFHIFYDNEEVRDVVEEFLEHHFEISVKEEIPTRDVDEIVNPPLIWRYFVKPSGVKLEGQDLSEKEYVLLSIMKINDKYKGAYVVSSGKNMGIFKGVGYPEDIANFYKLDEYEAYLWTAHGRFPTNTPGWWGGAHPFSLLDWGVVHNGEISSYGANKRYIEMFDYKCTMRTDTEVIIYLFDLLLRKHKLPLNLAVKAVASPFWNEIERLDKEEKKLVKGIRAVYGNSLLNGPFSIILSHKNGFLALNDRIKLRPLIVAEDGDQIYVASEEAAIREVCPEPEKIRAPRGGEPVIALLEGVENNEFEF